MQHPPASNGKRLDCSGKSWSGFAVVLTFHLYLHAVLKALHFDEHILTDKECSDCATKGPKAGFTASLLIKRSLKRLAAITSRARNQIATKPSQRFETPTVECPLGGDVRKYASAEERAAINQKTTVRHFGFTEKVYGLPFSTNYLATQHLRARFADNGGNAEAADGAVVYDLCAIALK